MQKISNGFFALGFFFNILKNITKSTGFFFFNAGSLLSNFLGHLSWFLSTLFSPNQAIKKPAWYSFTEFKNQYLTAAVFGMLSAICFALSIWFPVVNILGYCCAAIGNCFWLTSEYHLLNNPPEWDDQFDSKQQRIFLNYAGFMTLASLSTAVLLLSALIFPAASAVLIMTSTVVSLFLSVNAFQYWIGKNVGNNSVCSQEEKSEAANVSNPMHRLGRGPENTKSPPEKHQELRHATLTIQQSRYANPLENEIGGDTIENALVFK